MIEKVLQLDENEPWFFSDYLEWFLSSTLNEWTSVTCFVCQSTSVQWMVSGPLMDTQGCSNVIPPSPPLYPLFFNPLQFLPTHIHECPWPSMSIHEWCTDHPLTVCGQTHFWQLVSTWTMSGHSWTISGRSWAISGYSWTGVSSALSTSIHRTEIKF